jgi:hypothetical protein
MPGAFRSHAELLLRGQLPASVLANSPQAFDNRGQGSNFAGRSALQGQYPAVPSVDVFLASDERPDELRGIGFPGKELRPLLDVENQMTAINRLRADDHFGGVAQGGGNFPHH